MTMYKPVLKNIKKRLGYLIDHNDTTEYRFNCGLQTLQVIGFLARSVQYLANRGLMDDVTLIQAINTNCSKLYKVVQHHLM